MKTMFDILTFSDSVRRETARSNSNFITTNFQLIKSKLQEIESPGADIYLSVDVTGFFGLPEKGYDKYFNSCGEIKAWQFPYASVAINHRKNGDLNQDHIEFIRTDKGYKLLSVYLRNEVFKR